MGDTLATTFKLFKKSLLTSCIGILLFLGVFFQISPFTYIERAFAAALTTLSDTQSSLRVSTLSDHTIQFVTPTGLTTGQTIAVIFPGGYATGTFAVTNFDFATSTSASCSGFQDATLAGAPSGSTWGVAVASATVTFTSGTATIPANRCVQIKIGSNATVGGAGVSTITNPSTPGSYTILIAGTFADNGSITQNIISNDTVSVSATVQQSITFTISTTTIYFGNLSSAGPKFASSTNPSGDTSETIAHTLGVSTNAPSGYNLSIRGQTLTSQQNATDTISFMGGTATANATGTEQFGIRATSTGGTGATIDPTFSGLTTYGYDGTATTSTTFAVGTGSTNTTTFGLRYLANIGGTTEAGTYVANMIYVATANF